MAFKEFGVLFKSLYVCQQGYCPTPGIVLIITENDIFQVPFLPGPQGPMHHKSNPHIKWSEEHMFHDFLGQKIGEKTLLHHSERPFRIEDLSHTIRPLDTMLFWESTHPVMSTMGIQDEFIKEVKYRQAKNDRIDELEKLVAELSAGSPVLRTPNAGVSRLKAAEDRKDNASLKAANNSLY
jgi:hypothetical protein